MQIPRRLAARSARSVKFSLDGLGGNSRSEQIGHVNRGALNLRRRCSSTTQKSEFLRKLIHRFRWVFCRVFCRVFFCRILSYRVRWWKTAGILPAFCRKNADLFGILGALMFLFLLVFVNRAAGMLHPIMDSFAVFFEHPGFDKGLMEFAWLAVPAAGFLDLRGASLNYPFLGEFGRPTKKSQWKYICTLA